ncbi:hypothetical protein MUK42_26679 [Musa troglodytarum]|uniref:Cyclin-D1-binding protein 1-like N-terminal domain-containing protein n=1 Tax=Musa troglodytarum TaxID=320322 RepID=A0A9E7F3W5_9LILI|nr:hypothetical protein MUK42_26679 [Musa troglodytarum]
MEMSISGRRAHLSRLLDAHVRSIEEAPKVRLCPLLMLDLPVSTFLSFSCTVIVTADVGYPGGFIARQGGLVGGHQAGKRVLQTGNYGYNFDFLLFHSAVLFFLFYLDCFSLDSVLSLPRTEPLCKCCYAAGILWNGEAPDIMALEENMGVYCNILHGFLLFCHGSTVGAGPTLHASISASVKQVVECSIVLLREAVCYHGVYDTSNHRNIESFR